MPAPAREADGKTSAEARGVAPPLAQAAPSFTALELTAIEIGRRDRPALLRPGGRLARLARLLFGIEVPSPFADPRLEALRLLANALRHGRGVDVPIAAALASGITPEQIEVVKTRNPGQEPRTWTRII